MHGRVGTELPSLCPGEDTVTTDDALDVQPTPTIAPELRDLRILGACDNYTASSSGGAEKAAHELYSRLGGAGARIRVLSVPHGVPYEDPGVEVVTAKGLDLSRLVGGYLGVSPQIFRRAQQQRRSFRPDVLHANTIHYNGSIAVARLAARHSLPFVLTAQLGPVTAMPAMTRAAAAAYERTVGRYIVRRATRVLAVSATVRDHMIAIGAAPERVSVVENGVDHARFDMPLIAERDDPLVLSVGRIVDNKGPQLLVDAAISLAAAGTPIRVGFLGDGPLRASLEERVRAAGLTDRIVFHGQVTDVERWMQDADIVVRPSFTEGLPLAVLEAMSAGRCNIVSAIPPNLELIEHGVTGLAFRAGDAGDLAAQLESAITDSALRVQLAAAGRVASRRRSWDRMAAETGNALLSAAATRARG